MTRATVEKVRRDRDTFEVVTRPATRVGAWPERVMLHRLKNGRLRVAIVFNERRGSLLVPSVRFDTLTPRQVRALRRWLEAK